MTATKNQKRYARHRRVRARIWGTPQKPRLFVFKSNKHIYGGLADDTSGRTLASVSNMSCKKNDVSSARLTGEELAKLAQKLGVKNVVFDRGGYRYHGRVKALAEGARSTGLKF